MLLPPVGLKTKVQMAPTSTGTIPRQALSIWLGSLGAREAGTSGAPTHGAHKRAFSTPINPRVTDLGVAAVYSLPTVHIREQICLQELIELRSVCLVFCVTANLDQ